MTEWLGIAILVLFSLGLSLFMRLGGRDEQRELPKDVGLWVREPGSPDGDTYCERRALLKEGGLFKKTRLIEQRRRRRVADGKIVDVLPERTLDAWR